MNAPNLFILTGAPGTGKTAIMAELAPWIRCVAEPAREILSEQRSVGGAGTPDRDRSLFMDLLLQRSIDKHHATQGSEGPTLFDRGIPDCIAYARLLGVDPIQSVLASKSYRYSAEALVLEPWEDIYAIDEERTMTFTDTLAFQAAIEDAYDRAGYGLVVVPRESVEKRAAFVRDFIAERGSP